ncbi:MAG: TIM barrel protein [Luteitalea sp.]|nr:TIM barrel protein [Luteitalea sp.]
MDHRRSRDASRLDSSRGPARPFALTTRSATVRRIHGTYIRMARRAHQRAASAGCGAPHEGHASWENIYVDTTPTDLNELDRRHFLKSAGAGVTAAALLRSPREAAAAQEQARKAALDRLASNTYPLRPLFKQRTASSTGGGGTARAVGRRRGDFPEDAEAVAADPNAAEALAVAEKARAARAHLPSAPEMKAKYGEITLLDFPQFTKDTFPGVTRMDMRSALFGDVTDDSMFFPPENGRPGGFDPLSPSGRKWLDTLANILVKTGTKVQHISNNAPFELASYGSPEADARRKAGVAMAKRWLEGCAVLGIKSMRMNSPRALGPSIRPNAIARGPGDGYPRNIDVVPMLAATIESYKEMADAGGARDIRVTIENHWGLAADPANIRTIVDEVNHPYCEASPDFWSSVNGVPARCTSRVARKVLILCCMPRTGARPDWMEPWWTVTAESVTYWTALSPVRSEGLKSV